MEKEELEVTAKKPAMVEDEALQDDEAVVESQPEKELSERERIYAAANEKRLAESDPSTDEEDQPLPKEEEEVEVADPDSDDDDPVESEPENDPMIKLKVYGREFEERKSIVDKNGGKAEYQKKLAAAEKAEIERERKEIEAEKARLAEERNQFEAAKKTPSKDESKKSDLSPDDQADETEVRQKIAKAAESLFEGDVDTFTDSILSIVGQKKEAGKEVDVDAIIRKVKAETVEDVRREQQGKELADARRIFASEFPDIVASDELYRKADLRTISIMQEYPDKTPLEILRIAGDEVSRLYVQTSGVDNDEARRQQKLADKKRTTIAPGGSETVQRKPEPKQQTKADYVRELQKQRNQF